MERYGTLTCRLYEALARLPHERAIAVAMAWSRWLARQPGIT